LPPHESDLAGAGADIADRDGVFRQQAGDGQRAVGEIIVGIGEGDVRIENLRRRVDRVLGKRHRAEAR